MSSEGTVAQIDAAIAAFFSTGNGFTFLLGGILVVIVLWPIITGKDPDIHPFLLARQAQASPVRQVGESAVFRANEIPYGYPLRKGLGVKDPGAPAWTPGRDGDLRDVWRRAVQGATDDKGTLIGQKGKLLTILGREKVIEQSMAEATQAINAIGGFIQGKGGKVVAVSLSNSVELLSAVFASAFYGFKPVLIPYGLERSQTQALLSQVRADVLIAEAATIDLASALSTAPSIKNVIWVVKEGSKHIDWTEKPEGVGQIDIWQWHDIAASQKASSSVPISEKDSKTGPLATFWKGKTGQYELVEYTAENLVAGIGGLLSTMTRGHRLSERDILLPTASLTDSYALCWTLAALFSNATIALNSVASDSVDVTLAVIGAKPTVVVASSEAISKYHDLVTANAPGLAQKMSDYFRKKDIAAGAMPSKKPSGISGNMSGLRALLVSQRDTDDKSKLPSSVFAGLRLALGTRTAYALTSKDVAGAVSQTNILDYRDKGTTLCVGTPVSSLELFLRGGEPALDRDAPEGKITVRGPSVVGGTAKLDVPARIDVDRTITLL